MKTLMLNWMWVSAASFALIASWNSATLAEDEASPPKAVNPAPLPETPVPPEKERFQAFVTSMTNAKMIGRYTVRGKEDVAPKIEEYTIESVAKLPQGDYWLIKARIKYGDTDVTLPLPLEVKWAGDTPVITLTNLTFPGLGTFSARVLIYRDEYAGTWSHGEAGGHLYGRIERPKSESKEAPPGERDTEKQFFEGDISH